VFFDRLYLDTDEVIDDRLAAPFSDFLYPGSLNRRRVIHTRGHQAGTPNGAHWDAAGGMSTGAALLQRIARGEGLSKAATVELRGLEPLTSSMPSTVGLCGGPALRLAIGHPRPRLTVTVRADW
jgi:hypothetical protein